jgi:hypothetical protein
LSECKQCGSKTTGSQYCANCTTQYKNQLRSLSVGLPELRLIAARKASVVAHSQGDGNKSVAPIPLNMPAFQLQEDIVRFSHMLGKALTLHYNRHMPAESLLKAAELRGGQLLQRRDAEHLMAITKRYSVRLNMQLTPPEDKRLIGTCPYCQRDLWCTDSEIAGQYVVCHCGRTLKVRDVQEQHLLACALISNSDAQSRGGMAEGTASAIAKVLKLNGIDVRRQTIAQWKNRGVIKPIRYQGDSPVYRVWDVWKAMTR